MPGNGKQSEFPETLPLGAHKYRMNPFLIFIGLLLFASVLPIQLGLFGVTGKSATYVVIGALAIVIFIIIYGVSEKIEIYNEGIGFKTMLGREFILWENVERIRVSYSIWETLISLPAFRAEYDIYIGTTDNPGLIDLSSDINDPKLLLREVKNRAKNADVKYKKKLNFIFLHFDPEKFWREI